MKEFSKEVEDELTVYADAISGDAYSLMTEIYYGKELDPIYYGFQDLAIRAFDAMSYIRAQQRLHEVKPQNFSLKAISGATIDEKKKSFPVSEINDGDYFLLKSRFKNEPEIFLASKDFESRTPIVNFNQPKGEYSVSYEDVLKDITHFAKVNFKYE